MFPSKKGSRHLDNTTLPVVNDVYNGFPKIPSTPLIPRHGHLSRRSSVLLSPTKSKLITPKRYSLSEINPLTNKSGHIMHGAHSSGPLLASLSFKDNVSMYEETKSSGLARRIVSYNEEVEQERPPTHQEKYHSAGLFPIVHLFKKKPPLLEQSPKRVKIKLSSPDYLKNHLSQHKSQLLEGLARPRLQITHNLSTCSEKSETETKSVLDALKEISRKRIHSNEDCDLNEDSGKRIRTELYNGTTTTSKRNRADSPLLDTSESPPPKQTQKKFCVYDEFSASKSSSDFSFLNKMGPERSKRKTISTSTESLKETKHVKLINAETQTILSNTENRTKSVESSTDDFDGQKPKMKKSPLKVFDDAPLDRIRKNRLAALMGNLAGKDAAILPKPTTEDSLPSKPRESDKQDEPVEKFTVTETIRVPPFTNTTKENNNETDSANKPLISILSPSKTTKELSPVRSDKHVHFILPGTTSSSTFNQNLITQTSASIVTPISTSTSNSLISNNQEKSIGFGYPISSVEFDTKSLNIVSSISSHTFEKIDPGKDHIQISDGIATSDSNTIPASPQISKQDSFNLPKLTFEAPKTSSPQKTGGFKFDLKTSVAFDSMSTALNKTATSTLAFTKSPASNITSSSVSLSDANSTTFTFGKTNEPKQDSTFSFGAVGTNNSSKISEPTFSFGGGISKSPSFNNISVETKLPLTNSTSSGLSFVPTVNTPMLGDLNPSANFTTFGTTTTSTAGPLALSTSTAGNHNSQSINSKSNYPLPNCTFTQNTAVTTASAMFAFGGTTAVTSSSVFNSKPTSDFGSNNTSVASSSMFGSSVAAVAPSFGNIPATTSSVFGGIATTSTPGFGSTSVTSFGGTPVTSTSVFGTTPNTSKSVFGTTPVTSTATFGSTPVSSSAFSTTPISSTSVFGTTNTSVATGFGTATPTSSVFGTSNPSFGTNLTNTTPIFGSPNTKTPAFGSSSVFGATNTQTPTFGSNTTPGFGNPSHPKPVFGSSTTTPVAPSTFGNNTFGGNTNSTSTTTSGQAFGASNPNATFSFGPNKPATMVFGSATTTSSNTFGSNTFSSSSGFDSSSGFGNNTPAFGSSTTSSNTFGATNTPAFGQIENKSAFTFGGSGENKPNPVFGSGAGNSAFGKPINTQSSFGNSAGGFGSGTSGFTSQASGGFNFGSNATSPSPAPFTFGASSGNAEPPKPTFNFTGSSNPPAFGSNNSTPNFGSSNPSFGTPSFGTTGPPAAGVFNIGTGSNTGRPRTLRAKRRT